MDFCSTRYYGTVVIAGAGIIGLSCAWRLAQRGLCVTLFDAREAAREASWAGAGMLAPGGEFTGPTPLAMAAVNSLRLYPDFVRELEEESGRKIDFRQCGALDIACDPSAAAELDRRAAAQAAIGIPSAVSAHGNCPARFYSDDAVVNPRHVTEALLEACRRRGVERRDNEPILSITDGGHSIETSRERMRAEGVVIAAGAWSSALYPGLPASFPVRGHLIGWSGGAAAGEPILRSGHTYILQRANGDMVAGSSTERVGFDRAVDPAAVEEIRQRVRRLLPAAPVDGAAAWIGFRPGIEGGQPAVGQVAGTAVWTAYGHYRNGILLAPDTALRIAGLIANR